MVLSGTPIYKCLLRDKHFQVIREASGLKPTSTRQTILIILRLYTEDGNYDLVANNIAVFFIHDAIKFPDLIHSLKPEQHNEIPQASGAHDTFWDFVVSTPENAHMVLWLFSDRGIPRSFRMMEGFGVNTFRFVNTQGKARVS